MNFTAMRHIVALDSFLGCQSCPYIVFTFRYSYGFMFVMDYVCMYVCMHILGNSRWQRSRSMIYKARNHLCSHFAVYLSNRIKTWIWVYAVILVRSLLKDSPVRYSSKYYEDRVTGILQWRCSETSRYRSTYYI